MPEQKKNAISKKTNYDKEYNPIFLPESQYYIFDKPYRKYRQDIKFTVKMPKLSKKEMEEFGRLMKSYILGKPIKKKLRDEDVWSVS